MLCEHVYKTVGADICPHCGKDTHEIDWSRDREERRLHKEKHGLFYQGPQVWWSI
jgi:ribosomal protein L34E